MGVGDWALGRRSGGLGSRGAGLISVALAKSLLLHFTLCNFHFSLSTEFIARYSYHCFVISDFRHSSFDFRVPQASR